MTKFGTRGTQKLLHPQMCYLEASKRLDFLGNVKESKTPSFSSNIRFVFFLILLEFLAVILFEVVLLNASLTHFADDKINPILESSLEAAEGAVESLDPQRARDTLIGLSSSGFFERISIIDDYGETLAEVSREIPPNYGVMSYFSLLGRETTFDIQLELKTKWSSRGILIAAVNLQPIYSEFLKESLLRIFIVTAFSSFITLSILVANFRMMRNEIARLGVFSAAIGTNQSNHQGCTRNLRFKFREFEDFANRLAESVDKTLSIQKEKIAALHSYATALRTVGCFAILYDNNRQIVLETVSDIEMPALRELLLKKCDGIKDFRERLARSKFDILNVAATPETGPNSFEVALNGAVWIVTYLEEENGHSFIIAGDVTELKARDKVRLHSEKIDSLGRISANVAHEFNNMLAIILACLEQMQEPHQTVQEQEISIQVAERAGKRASSVVERLQSLTRVDQSSSGEVVDVSDWIENSNALFKLSVAPGVIIRIVCDFHGQVYGNAALLDSAFVNLLKNASDAMDGEGEVTIEIRKRTEQGQNEGQFVEILVKDSGSGFSSSQLDNLFEPFISTKLSGNGTGLGLSETYSYIKRMGGDITYFDQKTRGAAFKITLKAAMGIQNFDEKAVTKPKTVDSTKFNNLRVFILDDEVDLCTLLERQFSAYGAKVTTCTSFKEAEKYLDSNPGIEFAILDNQLPDGEGYKLAPKIKANSKNCICICLTGYASKVLDSREGIDEVISKPASFIKLREAFSNLLKTHPI